MRFLFPILFFIVGLQQAYSQPDTCKMLIEERLRAIYEQSTKETGENTPFTVLIRDTIMFSVINNDVSKLRMLASWARSERYSTKLRTDVDLAEETTGWIQIEAKLEEDDFAHVMLFLNRIRKKCEQLGIDPCNGALGYRFNYP